MTKSATAAGAIALILMLNACQRTVDSEATDRQTSNGSQTQQSPAATTEPTTATQSTSAAGAIASTCPIMGSENWKAHVNAMPGPGRKPQLGVSGIIITNTAGYQFRLERKATDFNPKIATVELIVTEPTGMVAQVITKTQVSGTFDATGASTAGYDQVTVTCRGKELAVIDDVTIAH